MFQKTVLNNGLRAITSPMLHTYSVCVIVHIGAGSRYESLEEAGLSHFVEHLCFKGTQRRETAKEIFEAIEGVGGVLNGGTDKELTIYWCRVPRPHLSLALDVMADMLRHSRFDPIEVEKERKIIIGELDMIMNSLEQRVGILIDEVIWPNQPLGRCGIGSKETVGALSREMLLDYQAHQYIPGNTVVSVAGDISHDQVVTAINEVFSDWPGDIPRAWYPAEDEQQSPRLRVEQRNTEQAHFCLALRGVSYLHPDRFVVDLLNVILGGEMSSRLFLEIRERQGLAYDVHSYVNHYHDSGSLTIYALVEPKHIETTIKIILAELSRLKEGIPPQELVKAKELSKGRMMLRMEDTRGVTGWIGLQELLSGHIYTVEEVVSIIDAITPEDVQRVARELLVTEKLNLAIVGPFHSERQFEGILKL